MAATDRVEARPLDVDAVRCRFPALLAAGDAAAPAHLDGPAGAQVPRAVVDASVRYLTSACANLDAASPASQATQRLVEEARATFAAFLGAAPDEIVFGLNMTTINHLLVQGLRGWLGAGDRVVVTALEHDANVAPWHALAREVGAEVVALPVRADGELDVAALEAAVTPRTRVVAFTLASNALGTVPPVAELVAAARAVGAITWADGVHAAAHRRIDRVTEGLDVVLCSTYKFCGPHLGVAAVDARLEERLSLAALPARYRRPWARSLELGTLPFESLAGAVAAVEHIAGQGEGPELTDRLASAFAAIATHEGALAAELRDGLASIPGVRLHGWTDATDVARRTPTFCFTVAGSAPAEVGAWLATRGVYVSHGTFHAVAALAATGAGAAAVRAGLLHYNTHEDVERLLSALHALTTRTRPRS